MGCAAPRARLLEGAVGGASRAELETLRLRACRLRVSAVSFMGRAGTKTRVGQLRDVNSARTRKAIAKEALYA